MYPTSKTWVLFESEFEFPVPQQLTPSIEVITNPINNQQQQSFTSAPVPIYVTPDPANFFGLTLLIYQLTISFGLARIDSIPPADLLQ